MTPGAPARISASVTSTQGDPLNPVARPHFRWHSSLLLALVSLLLAASFAATAQAAPVTTDAVLLETEDVPWSDEFNPQAMAAAFGANWEKQEFATVQADEGSGGLFAPHVRFIWIEGSD